MKLLEHQFNHNLNMRKDQIRQ